MGKNQKTEEFLGSTMPLGSGGWSYFIREFPNLSMANDFASRAQPVGVIETCNPLDIVVDPIVQNVRHRGSN
jgi:hypothetical protein